MTSKVAHLAPDLPDADAGGLSYWVDDAELAARAGVPRDVMRRALQMYDADPRSGFPKAVPIYGNRRYWPAIQDYWNEIYRPKIKLLRSTSNDR